MMKQYTIPVFIPELACPFRCVFCNQFKITGQERAPSDDQILKTIEDYLASFKVTDRRVEIGFFGGSFTGLPLEQQEHYFSLVRPYILSGKISAIRLSTRPDYITNEILDLLRKYHVGTIELGLQSLDEEVLRMSRRGHTVQHTREAARKIKKAGFDMGLQMMIGLPGDSLEKARNTAEGIIQLGATQTRIYPALVIRDTTLHSWYREGKYEPLTMEEAIRWSKELILLFEQSGIKLLRVGLHPSDGLLNGSELIAGPFHPSFRELVMTDIWSDLLVPLLQLPQGNKIVLKVPQRELNVALGYQGKNKKSLQTHFREVKFQGDPSIIERNNFQYRLFA